MGVLIGDRMCFVPRQNVFCPATESFLSPDRMRGSVVGSTLGIYWLGSGSLRAANQKRAVAMRRESIQKGAFSYG